MTIFLVDDREPEALVAKLAAHGARVRRLDHGDVHAGPWVVERKTVADFARSLLDGRLFRQAAELRESGLHPILAVEGPLAELSQDLLPVCHGALATLAGPLRVPVVPTSDVDGTVQLVRSLLKRRHAAALDVAEPLVKLRRADPYLAMLAQVPGVGGKRAAELAARWPSFAALAELRFTDIVDETGPKTAAAIWQVVHGRDVPAVYAALGTGKRARALVEAYPGLERGEAVPHAAARRVAGKTAADRIAAFGQAAPDLGAYASQ